MTPEAIDKYIREYAMRTVPLMDWLYFLHRFGAPVAQHRFYA